MPLVSSSAMPVHGTLGILLRSIRRGQLTAPRVADLLRAIPERSTLHIKPSLLREILAEVAAIGNTSQGTGQEES